MISFGKNIFPYKTTKANPVLLSETIELKKNHCGMIPKQISIENVPILVQSIIVDCSKTCSTFEGNLRDTTVAQLLKEKTAKYRQTLLESAQQLLAQHAEPGLGIIELIEDQNMITERLRLLKKNNWQHRHLKFVIVNIVFAVMCFSILPMTQAEKQKVKPFDHSKNELAIDNLETLQKTSADASLEIINITEESKENKMEKTYLKNVIPLQSTIVDTDAAGRECYLFGALESALKYLGEPVDYSYLMRVSGCTFRIVVTEGGITAYGPGVSSDYYYPIAIKAVGYQDKQGLEGCGGEAWKDIPKIQQAM